MSPREKRVLVITGAKRAAVENRCAAASCGPGEAVVKIAAVGVCATDVELYDGTMGYFESGLAKLPLVPGHEWAGEILALGEDAPEHLSIGQRVIGEHATGCMPQELGNSSGTFRLKAAFSHARCELCSAGVFLRCPRRTETGFFGRDGAFQTEIIFPSHQLHVIPEHVPFELAVLSEPLATAHKAVRLAGLGRGSAGTAPAAATAARRAVVDPETSCQIDR
eukprot:TRINITY_DN94943_c0_g1_i1.p1 TRINITY_DN94943_c0_g1~~TRINITY_DN94943_c0_g1_i1.p1  ORF type:complete len:239 (-),score=23.45 TRINITY_DN94943_c0_g1_i1:51-716(-)